MHARMSLSCYGDDRMTERTSRISGGISPELFRFATAAIRMHSDELLRFVTLPDVINDFTQRNLNLYEGLDKEDAELHLRIVPSNGDVSIDIQVLKTSMSSIEESVSLLEEILQTSVTLIDAVSLLLFEYVVHKKANDILERMFDKIDSTKSESKTIESSRKRHSH